MFCDVDLDQNSDFITTWQGIKHSRDISIEQNPIARWLFHTLGVPLSFALLACMYVILVVLMHVAFYPMVDFTHQLVPMISKDIVLWAYLICYMFGSTFVSVVQWQKLGYTIVQDS